MKIFFFSIYISNILIYTVKAFFLSRRVLLAVEMLFSSLSITDNAVCIHIEKSSCTQYLREAVVNTLSYRGTSLC